MTSDHQTTDEHKPPSHDIGLMKSYNVVAKLTKMTVCVHRMCVSEKGQLKNDFDFKMLTL